MQYEARIFSLPEIQGLSKKQLDAHLGLYQGYVKHVNLLSGELSRLAVASPDNAYTVGELRKRLGFEFNGMRLHELYFEQIESSAQIINADTQFYSAIVKQFGSYDMWYEEFMHLSGRGPGWALLDYDPVAKQFHHVWVSDHEVGQLAGCPVIFALDHWEHAYLVDYLPAEKQKYLDAYFAAVNWSIIASRFDAVLSVSAVSEKEIF